MSQISANLKQINQRIHDAALKAGRESHDIQLLAVSKTKPLSAIEEAIAAGQRAFGENYLQEGVEKITALSACPGLEWHFIGPIQSNKTRPIAEHFHWAHGVERAKIARRLNEQRPAHLAPLNICLQVNLDGEASKSGVAPEDCLDLARQCLALERLRLRGLMCIPQPRHNFEEQKATFLRLTRLRDTIAEQLGMELDTLSMGMSADLEAAIAAGSTLVRVGTDIFGARDYSTLRTDP